MTFREKISDILQSYYKHAQHQHVSNEEAQKGIIIETAARLIKVIFKTNTPSITDHYSEAEEFKLTPEDSVNSFRRQFVSGIAKLVSRKKTINTMYWASHNNPWGLAGLTVHSNYRTTFDFFVP